jgi:hypothetical protein
VPTEKPLSFTGDLADMGKWLGVILRIDSEFIEIRRCRCDMNRLLDAHSCSLTNTGYTP